MTPYDAGWKAYFEKTANPYEEGSSDHRDFENGHYDAMSFAERFAA